MVGIYSMSQEDAQRAGFIVDDDEYKRQVAEMLAELADTDTTTDEEKEEQK